MAKSPCDNGPKKVNGSRVVFEIHFFEKKEKHFQPRRNASNEARCSPRDLGLLTAYTQWETTRTPPFAGGVEHQSTAG